MAKAKSNILERPIGITVNYIPKIDSGKELVQSSIQEDTNSISIETTTKGFKLPQLTTTQRDALTPATGMKIFNTTTNQEEIYKSGGWEANGNTNFATVSLRRGVYRTNNNQSFALPFPNVYIIDTWNTTDSSISDFNTSTGVFTASRDMRLKYKLKILVLTNGFLTTHNIYLNIYKNNTFQDRGSIRTVFHGGLTEIFLFGEIDLSNGDTIDFRFTYDSGGASSYSLEPNATYNIAEFQELPTEELFSLSSPYFVTGGVAGITSVSEYADDTAAATGGIPIGGIYRTGSALKIRVS